MFSLTFLIATVTLVAAVPQMQILGDEEASITTYFNMGFSYETILAFCATYHGLIISLRTLKRRLRTYGLCRWGTSTWSSISAAIRTERTGPARNCGYRSLWRTLRTKYGLRVNRETVREFLAIADPCGVAERQSHRLHRRTYRSRGPNDTWHLDGYDKLKMYGIAISGCIDGFSRRIIWLRCSATNSDPGVIGSYYLDAVQSLMRCPTKVRSDRGSENSVVAALQCLLSGNYTHGHVFGTSPANQRIESFWSFLRKFRIQWWMDIFEDLVAAELLDTSNEKHVECIRYCLMSTLQKELETVQLYWNTHRIRPSSGALCPGGIPDELYFLPQTNTVDVMVPVDPGDVAIYRAHVKAPFTCVHSDFFEYLQYVQAFHSWQTPQSWSEAIGLYIKLISLL